MDKTSEELFKVSKEKYGQEYTNHLFEQYKLYVASTDKISERRQKNNDFFVALNTAFLAILSYVSTKIENPFWLIISMSAIIGIIIDYYWYRTVKSYKDLNGEKFNIIHDIENHLPTAPFKTEWEGIDKGEDSKSYWPVSHIEAKIPWLFIIFYVIIFFWSLYNSEAIALINKVCK